MTLASSGKSNDGKLLENTEHKLQDVLNVASDDVKSRTQSLTELYSGYKVRKEFEKLNLISSNSRAPRYKNVSSKKRLYRESDYLRLKIQSKISKGETPFSKDYARIIHSPAFRRLQGKSQLIPAGESEFFRTRLTHSLEVADIAVRIASRINDTHPYFKKNQLNLDLINCACILHDIGHPPFGHCGEEALAKLMVNHGGFEGNAQTLRIITCLENRLGEDVPVQTAYDSPAGLDLTVRTIASVIKYDKICAPSKDDFVSKGYYKDEHELVLQIKSKLGIPQGRALETIESQIMDLADDIAYSAYDLEDTMEAGMVNPLDAMAIEDASLKEMVKDVRYRIKKRPELSDLHFTETDFLYVMQNVFSGIIQPSVDNKYHLSDREKKESRLDFVAFFGRSYLESGLHVKNRLVRRQFLETLIRSNIDAVTVQLDPQYPLLSKIDIQSGRRLTIECMKSFNFHRVIYSKQLQFPQYRNYKIIEFLFDTFLGEAKSDCDKLHLFSDEEKRYWRAIENNSGKSNSSWQRFVCDKIASLTDKDAVQLFNKLNPAGEPSFFGYL